MYRELCITEFLDSLLRNLQAVDESVSSHYQMLIMGKFSFQNPWESLGLQVFCVNNLATTTIKYRNTITEKKFFMSNKSRPI